ncbi:MAG: hypothetical protein ACI4V4_02940, partial [Eubacterium sp.]
KILAVLMVLSMIFALSACASKEYKDTVVTIPVTDENGEEVTDEEGKVVTEIVTENSTAEASSKAENDDNSTEKNSKETTNKSSKTTTAASKKNDVSTSSSSSSNSESSSENAVASGKETTVANSDSKATTQTTTSAITETTTEKSEKREVTVQIELPFYNDLETKLSVSYKAAEDKKYTKLEFENPTDKKEKLTYETVRLDGKTVKTYELGKIKGDVTVKISMTGVDLSNETIVIPASESTGTISPVTGIEMMQGEDD